MIEVVPITTTVVNWNQYLLIAKQLLNRSISLQLDELGMRPDCVASYLVTIGSLLNIEPKEIILGEHSLLRHAAFGFLIVADQDTIFSLMSHTQFIVSTTATDTVHRLHVGVVSGDLGQWREAIINGSGSPALRAFLGKCMIYFEKIGLGSLWHNFYKHIQTDGTFLLESK